MKIILIIGYLLLVYLYRKCARSGFRVFLVIIWCYSAASRCLYGDGLLPMKITDHHYNQQLKQTMADRNGKWRVSLDPEPAGGPYDLIVKGKKQYYIHDVLVGEVWFCSGQSNMELIKNVRNAEAEIDTAGYPEIRHIKIPMRMSEYAKG